MSESCTCYKCRGACQRRPGWFLPGEAEKAAALKGLPLRKFFKKYLGVDWGKEEHEDENTFLLAPAIVGMKRGEEYPADPIGQCIFYRNGLCDIHDAAPFECREYLHTDTHEQAVGRKRVIKEAWKAHQEQIRELLGRQYPRSGRTKDDLGEWI